MTPHLTRAQLLIQRDRFDEAAQTLRQGLAEDPDEAATHAMLGYVLVQTLEREDLATAERHLGRSITLRPDHPFGHYALGELRLKQGDATRARQSADEALRLDPYDADHYALRAQIETAARKWKEAAAWAEKGLAIDAEHQGCVNLRAIALSHSGRHGEARSTIDAALRAAPEDSYAHANRGWSELHAGKPKAAIQHFHEALRLQPTNEFARSGMVEALKAKNPIYRLVLAFFLWMMRLSPRVQVGVLVGGFIGYQLLLNVNAATPSARVITLPLIVAYFVFAVLTWVSVPLFNLVLAIGKNGRAALSDQQKRGAWLFGVFLALPVVVVAAAIVIGTVMGSQTVPMLAGKYSVNLAFLLLPVSAAANAVGTPRFRIMGGIVLGLCLLLLARVVMDCLGSASPELDTFYTYAFIGSVWGMIFLGVKPPVR